MRLHTAKVKKHVKRLLLTLLIIILSFTVVSMIATVVYFHTGYPRTDKVSKFSYSYTEMASKGYASRKVEFPSGSNTLTGYCYSADVPRALVVIASGFGDSGRSHLGEMMRFVDADMSVLCYDATGVGESEGGGKIGLAQPSLDLNAALDYVDSDAQLCDLPIFLYGHSAGGYAAATCVSRERVHAAVIIAGFESPVLLMRESARPYVGFLADMEYPFLSLENHFVFNGEGEKRASDVLRNTDVPVVVYEGSDDRSIPPAARISRYLDFERYPNLTLHICDAPPRNMHYGMWLSEESFSYRNSLGKEAATADSVAANQTDDVFMDEVIALYRDTLG